MLWGKDYRQAFDRKICLVSWRIWTRNLSECGTTASNLGTNASTALQAMSHCTCNGNLHRLISAAIGLLAGGWLLTEPNYHFSLGGKSCALAPLTIIPKFPKENKRFSQIYYQNPAHLCVPYVWLLRDTKCFLENIVNQKWRMWRIASKKTNGGRDFCLEIDAMVALCVRMLSDYFYGCGPCLSYQARDQNEFSWMEIY